MIYSICNDKLKVDICDKGAELKSVFATKLNHEYLYQKRKGHWVGSSPILFPICGKLYEGITKDGKLYKIPFHGFAKSKIFKVTEKKKDKITFSVSEDEKTLKVYPFKFTLNVSYTLKNNLLKMDCEVVNTGKDELPFSIGGHPGFCTPLEDKITFKEHYLEFDKPCKITSVVLSGPYNSGKTKKYPLVDDKIIPLRHDLFDDDAVFFNGMSHSLTLKSDKTDRYVKVSSPNATHIGIWHDPKRSAPFICIEPWHGIPATVGIVDDFKTKKEFIHLKPKEKYIFNIDFEVKA